MGYWANRRRDIAAVMERDPAARSAFEVVTCYAGYKAVRSHRRAHWLWVRGAKWLARRISQRCARRTGIEIHPGAVIGEGFFIDHGNGVVIGETTIIGDNVTLYQGVTLGGTGKEVGKRHPTIGDGVMIGAGAKIIGPFTVGEGSKIGAGAVVNKEVPPHCTVVGNPGRVVRRGNERVQSDPVKEAIDLLTDRILHLENCLARLTLRQTCEDCPDNLTNDCFKTEGELTHADL